LFASYIKFPAVVEEVLYYCPIACLCLASAHLHLQYSIFCISIQDTVIYGG